MYLSTLYVGPKTFKNRSYLILVTMEDLYRLTILETGQKTLTYERIDDDTKQFIS